MRIVEITWKSKDYDPSKIESRYVKFAQFDDRFYICEKMDNSPYDMLQGVVSDLPPATQLECRKLAGYWPSYVRVDKQGIMLDACYSEKLNRA